MGKPNPGKKGWLISQAELETWLDGLAQAQTLAHESLRDDARCPRCSSVTAAYQKGMEDRLKSLVSLERFERSAK